MIIRLSKGKNDKSGTLTCLRDDGSSTWQKSSDYFAYHDLIHYAVETTLGFRDAFLGLVAKGKGLDEFGTRNGRKDVYTEEEGWAEGIVGAIQWPTVGGGPRPSDDELFDQMGRTFADLGHTPPPVTRAQFHAACARMRELHRQWARVPEGGTLELTF